MSISVLRKRRLPVHNEILMCEQTVVSGFEVLVLSCLEVFSSLEEVSSVSEAVSEVDGFEMSVVLSVSEVSSKTVPEICKLPILSVGTSEVGIANIPLNRSTTAGTIESALYNCFYQHKYFTVAKRPISFKRR